MMLLENLAWRGRGLDDVLAVIEDDRLVPVRERGR
jgi:hypothetical protein